MFDILKCPVCGEKLNSNLSGAVCNNNHCFDLSKEGYLNLLIGNRAGESIGDNRDMARSRKNFLDKGYYRILADEISSIIKKNMDSEKILDICCGEGYYAEAIKKENDDKRFYGFDISKEMIRLASKRKSGAEFFVANISNIPVVDESVDVAYHLFAPFHADEFYRVIRTGGTLITVIPGERHLYGLKSVLYENPYLNDEKEPDIGKFVISDEIKVSTEITLNSREDVMALLKMTPYYYHTPTDGLNRLSELENLKTEIDFKIIVLQK